MLSEVRISVHDPPYMYMEPASTFEITSLSLCGLIEAITVTPQLIPFRMLSNYKGGNKAKTFHSAATRARIYLTHCCGDKALTIFNR